MRYLNKIVFINSAHIPYAEINLDGNVHFIGTQGVGKSTLLRAILFFYNVDKSKLGIRTQDKQKSYDEFYFPYPNSYIIYEGCRENGKFFVMTFVSSGRVAFRIVDCPYERHFFLDDDNNVRYEWGKISEQIGPGVFRSNIIRGYEEFRDIIYGNMPNVNKDLRRFNLMESSRYQNVPRTIQNIFLNQSLESRVIKDTIIDSMDFAGDGIDLNFYREQLKDFRRQYEDIWKWYKKEANGKVKVQTDADKVIDKYSLYEVTVKAIKEWCAKLNYALERDIGKLPEIKETLASKSQELDRQQRLLDEEKEKFNKERDGLKGQEAVLNDFLKQTKEKRRHYDEIGINIILEKISKEKELLIRKDSLENQERTLTDRHQNVKTKYEALKLEIKKSLQEHELHSGQKINEIEQERMKKNNVLQDEHNAQADNVNDVFQQKMEDIRKDIDSAREEKNNLKIKENKISTYNPFQKEMDERRAQIHDLEKRKYSITSKLNEIQQKITKITNETESKRKDLENNFAKEQARLNNERAHIKLEADQLQGLLSSQKGSFIEWLDGNVPDWKNGIGKVVDDKVLYNTSLEPEKSESSATLYGISIELRNIEKTVLTPDEIRMQLLKLDSKFKNIEQQAAEMQQTLESEITELERLPNNKLKTLRMNKMNLDAELGQIPFKIKRFETELDEYQTKLENWRKRELTAIGEQLGKTGELIDSLSASKQRAEIQKQKDMERLRQSFNRRKKDIDTIVKQKKDEINEALERLKAEARSQTSELEARMDAELKGLGVDVNKLSEIRDALGKLATELQFIDNHKTDYFAWQHDKEQYFDKESSKNEERKLINQKLDDLQQKFNLRKQKKEKEVRVLSDEIHSMQQEQANLTDAIERVKIFKLNESCPKEIMEVENQETQDPLSNILDKLRDTISGQQQRMEDFKRAVVVFKSNFSPQNTFHFRTEFNADEDYTEFASELHEFMYNKKIEEYRIRTSNLYADIIKRIAREVGDLNKHNAEIKSTINEINRDFREDNFAGVIKEIELRAVESNDRLMQQLLNIKKFDEDYGFDIGQLNLFSSVQNQDKINQKAVTLLMSLTEMMDADNKRESITLSDTFKLEFKVKENDNDTNWVEKLSNVGSDGTDILVKSMVNIMLINVFKKRVSKHFDDFKLHCMMDEIGKLHPDNVEGILKFANMRNIYLINSSPTTYNAQVYKYTYALSKDDKNNTVVKTLLTIR